MERFHELSLPAEYGRVQGPVRRVVTCENRYATWVFAERVAADPIEGEWFLNTQPHTAQYVRFCIDDYYRRVARTQRKRVRAFAEKLFYFRYHYLDFLNIYERGRLVVLVRDPRDMFVSQRGI